MKAVDFLKNTKIYLQDRDESIRFQQIVFKLGVEWFPEGISTFENGCYLTIDNSLKMNRANACTNFDLEMFMGINKRQIFLSEVMSLEPKTEFKEGDAVLVRNSIKDEWISTDFVNYTYRTKYAYACIDGRLYKYCMLNDNN